jgi:hypothetical protein
MTDENDGNKYTRIFEALATTMEYDVDFTGRERVIVIVNDDDTHATGILGYEREGDAVIDLISHLQGIFEANGRHLFFAPIAGEG